MSKKRAGFVVALLCASACGGGDLGVQDGAVAECRPGTVQVQATTPPVCVPCASGAYCAGGESLPKACTSGTWDHDADPATECAGAATCGAGSYVAEEGDALEDRVCEACPAGTFTTTEGADACSAWRVCEPGQLATDGTASTDRTCRPAWVRHVSATSSAFTAGVGSDAQGNVVVAGVIFDPGALVGQTRLGQGDGFVVKYDPAGNVLWGRHVGTEKNENLSALAVDPSGNVFVGGSTSGTFAGQAFLGVADAFVLKLDASGNTVWSRQFGTANGEQVLGLAIDDDGNVLAAGYGGDAFPGQSASGLEDVFVRKMDASGNELWTRQFGSSFNERGNAIAVDPHGNVFVTGYTTGNVSGSATSHPVDLFVRKFDPSGATLWTRQLLGLGDDSGTSLDVDAFGFVYVAGRTTSALSNQTNAGSADAFLMKFDTDGNGMWTREFGGAGSDEALGVRVSAVGDVFVAGRVAGALPDQTAVASVDAFVRKYRADGTEAWTRQFGSNTPAQCAFLSVDGSGNLAIVGSWADAQGVVPLVVTTSGTP